VAGATNEGLADWNAIADPMLRVSSDACMLVLHYPPRPEVDLVARSLKNLA
jgi:hypothetical protein